MKTFITLVAKSPWSKGRYGPHHHQDWVRACGIAAKEVAQNPEAEILVVDGFQAQRQASDLELYCKELVRLKVDPERIRTINQGNETVAQLEIVEEQATKEKARVLLISTFLHYLRVRWLCRGLGYEHRVAWGIPRPREAVTDIILMFIFPILDLLDLRPWFQRQVTGRREDGKL